MLKVTRNCALRQAWFTLSSGNYSIIARMRASSVKRRVSSESVAIPEAQPWPFLGALDWSCLQRRTFDARAQPTVRRECQGTYEEGESTCFMLECWISGGRVAYSDL